MNLQKILIILLFLSVHTILPAQDKASAINFAHLYDPAEEIGLTYKLVNHPDQGNLVILAVDIRNESLTLSDYIIQFYGVENYETAFQSPLTTTDSVYMGARENTRYIGYHLPLTSPLIIVKVTSKISGLSFYQDINTSHVQQFLLMDEHDTPVTYDYITEGNYKMLTKGSASISFYDHTFPAGRPPMTTQTGSVPRSLNVTKSFQLDSVNDHMFNDHGLYAITPANGEVNGEAFRVQGVYYPEYVTIEDLVDPLIYITTKEERAELQSVGDDKNGFDNFWVALTGSQDRAKWIIKNYYQHVTEANQMFTTYKEGWETDRGMIYIMFGTPDQVTRSESRETWSYLAGKRLPPMIFNFINLQTRYADKQYSLMRTKDYANGWMMAAKYWRESRPFDQR